MCRPSAVPELVVSTQPWRPHRHALPPPSTVMWPSWPAEARPRSSLPSAMTAPPIPVPIVNMTTFVCRTRRADGVLGEQRDVAVIVDEDGPPRHAGDRLGERLAGEVDIAAGQNTAPVCAFTRPGTPMPMAATPPSSSDWTSSPIWPATRAGSAGVGRAAQARTSPADDTRAARTCVPPMSTPIAVAVAISRRDGALQAARIARRGSPGFP